MQSLSAQKLRFTRRIKQTLKERLFLLFFHSGLLTDASSDRDGAAIFRNGRLRTVGFYSNKTGPQLISCLMTETK